MKAKLKTQKDKLKYGVYRMLTKEIITTSEFKKFKAHYDTRNDCAHPTKVKLSPNEVISIFENIFDYVFNNPKLK